jgi:hypothetical protein
MSFWVYRLLSSASMQTTALAEASS